MVCPSPQCRPELKGFESMADAQRLAHLLSCNWTLARHLGRAGTCPMHSHGACEWTVGCQLELHEDGLGPGTRGGRKGSKDNPSNCQII